MLEGGVLGMYADWYNDGAFGTLQLGDLLLSGDGTNCPGDR